MTKYAPIQHFIVSQPSQEIIQLKLRESLNLKQAGRMVSCHTAVQITCTLWIFCRLVAAYSSGRLVAFPGIPVERSFYPNKTVLSATTQEECFTKICPRAKQKCSGVFSAKDRVCFKIPELSPLVIFWGWERILRPYKDFVTLVSRAPIWATMPLPVVLWLLDQDYRGKNLGTGDSAMELFFLKTPLYDAASFHAKGPFTVRDGPSTNRIGYLQVSPANKQTMDYRVYFLVDGRIDFEKGFTISLWIKTDAEVVMILSYAASMAMWLFTCGKIGISHKGYWDERSMTPILRSPKVNKHWRHIAASYEGGRGADPSFYLNGRLMQLEYSSNAKMITPNITAVLRTERKSQTRACHLIFDRPLSQKQIRHVMNLCP